MAVAVVVAGLVAAPGCTERTDSVDAAAPTGVAEPAAGAVDGVVFLVGDAGAAEEGRSPLIEALKDDVERWAAVLADSSVAVVYLGDNVYEVGIRNPSHPEYARDTLRMNTQVRVVTGPAAARGHVQALFLPGNHDWGNATGERGLARARNMERHLRALASDTASVRYLPPPGEPGPTVVDVGTRIRILAMDGHWWLQMPPAQARDSVLARVAAALEGAGQRRVVVSSHLPLLTGGPHGGTIGFLPTLGIRYLAHKSGVLVQDVTSNPYKDLIAGFYGTFATAGVPVAFAAGHDHSLQVLQDAVPGGATLTQLVSGSGSKTTPVRRVPGMLWARQAPGYMRLSFLSDGGVLLHVVAGARRHIKCPHEDQARAACMAAGADSVHAAYSRRLR